MAKIFCILSATLALQACITAAPNADNRHAAAIEESLNNGQVDPKLNSEPNGKQPHVFGEAKVIDDKNLQGLRQKRFYDYFDFDLHPFGPYNNNYLKRDESQNTGVYGAQDFMLQILRRVQTILSYTRQQASHTAHFPVPLIIPVYYTPHASCDCNPAEIPDNGGTHGTDARPTQATTTAPPADGTTQGLTPAIEPDSSSTVDTNKTTPDFFSRMPEVDDDEEDGSRPISFVPIKPKIPLSKPPPPVEHGTIQASSGSGVNEFANTTPPPVIMGLPPQADLPTNSIPTLCDGAVLTCCHRAEVTYDCFTSQGCPNPTSPDNPCDENLVLRIISKFQYYYANRRG